MNNGLLKGFTNNIYTSLVILEKALLISKEKFSSLRWGVELTCRKEIKILS